MPGPTMLQAKQLCGRVPGRPVLAPHSRNSGAALKRHYARRSMQRAPAAISCVLPEDAVKERTRRFRRVVYDHDRWTKHRSADRHAMSMFNMLTSHILWSISKPVLWVCIVSTMVCAINSAIGAGLIGNLQGPLLSTWLNPLVLNLTSGAMSLLLVFRTNSCYGRFDEARKMIGGTLNRCRDIARQVTTSFPVGYDAHAAAVCQWLVAYVRAVRCHLQNEGDLATDLKGVLHPDDLRNLLEAPHRPVMALQMLSAVLAKVQMETALAIQIGQNITFFHDQLGGSERILRTPIPLSYTRHTERFMLIWLTLLPFGLWTTYGWATVPLSCLISMVFLAIDEIAIEIEEPFGIIPMDSIADIIQHDVLAQLRARPTILSALADRGLVSPLPLMPNGSGSRNGNGNGNGNGSRNGNGSSNGNGHGNGNGNGRGLVGDYRPNGNGSNVAVPAYS